MSKSVKKKNDKNKDLIVVLFIFAIIILMAVGLTMCGRDEIEIGEMKSNTTYEKQEEDNRDEIVIMTTVGVAVFIVICFAIKKAKDIERRNQAIKEHNRRLEEQKRLEEAKERVRQARLQEMIDAGINQLTQNNGRRSRTTRNADPRTNRRWDDEFDSYDMNDKKLDAYYQGKYNGYDDLLDDVDDYEEEEPTTLWEKIKYKFAEINSYWWIVIGIAIVAVIGGVIIILSVL